MPRKSTGRGRGKSRGRGRGRGKARRGRGRARGRGRGRGRGTRVSTRSETTWYIVKPTVVHVDNPDAEDDTFNEFVFDERTKHNTKAILPSPTPGPNDVDEVIMAECCAYYPDKFMEDQWIHLLEHVDSKSIPQCKRYKVDVADVYHFYAMIYYFGIVRLPAKKDYWKTSDLDVMPSHPVCTARNMTYRKFQYIWNHISTVSPDSATTSAVTTDASAAAAATTDASVAAAATTQWPSDEESDDDSCADGDQLSDDDDDDEDDGDESSHDDDFEFDHKATPYINQFNEATKKLFKFPSSNIAIDEMMARFKGRSRDTYRMKAKPIKEGFKYFAIADSQSTFV